MHFPQIESQGRALPDRQIFSYRHIFSERMESQLDIQTVPSHSDLEGMLYMTQTITNRVKELRIALGWTQEQLAQAACVSRQSINSIERNRYVPSLELALTFARIFSCPTDQIFHLENPS